MCKEREIWRDVVGFEGLYKVSNLGNVKSLNYKRTGKEKVLKPIKNTGGYLQIWLIKDGRRYTKSVHRLVAEAFIPNPDNLPCVNHKDENKTNNKEFNLEFCTYEYNINYGNRNERAGKKIAERLSKPVICIETGFIFASTMDAERKTGISNGQISSCCNGKKGYKTAGSFHWRYVEKEGVVNA